MKPAHFQQKSRPLPPVFDKLKLQAAMATQTRPANGFEVQSFVKAACNCIAVSQIRQERAERISARTLALMEERRKQKFGLTSGSISVVLYTLLCKQVRWSLTDDLRKHNDRVMKCAIDKLKIRHARHELAYERRQIAQLRYPDGTLTTAPQEAMAIATTFYNDLYRSRDGPFVFSAIGSLRRPITAEELRNACRRIRGNTAPGADGIPSGATKHLVPLCAEDLANALNHHFEVNEFPESFMKAKTILLYKKGDPLNISNYRPISLLSTVLKVLTRALARRVEEVAMELVPEEQAGFRRKFSTRDHILSVNLLMEKCSEWRKPLNMAFIDYQKAFDTIEYKYIWKALEKFGVDDCTVRMIKQLYAAGRSFLALGTMEMEIDIQRGVRQGDSLSPLLFILTLQSCLDEIDWCDQGYPIEHVRLNYLAYADDMFLCSPTVDGLQAMLDKLIDVTKKAGLKVNSSKTKWMSNNHNGQQLRANGEEIELVSSFVYLGQLVCFPQDRGQEVSRRISAAWGISRKVRALLRSRMTPIKTKRRFFHTCVLPTLLYGSETWALTKAAEDRIRKCQRRMERQMLGLRLRDRVSNAVLRARTKLKDAVVEARKRKWIYANKLMTREQTRWEVRLMKWKPYGIRPVGRPRMRWEDDFKMFAGTEWKNIAATSEWFEIMARFSVYIR
ncbi:hypothetical protein V3C99_009956 [Haemonchus contortus]